MASASDVRDLELRECDRVCGGGIDLPPVELPWPHGPILTGTGPYGGEPIKNDPY